MFVFSAFKFYNNKCYAVKFSFRWWYWDIIPVYPCRKVLCRILFILYNSDSKNTICIYNIRIKYSFNINNSYPISVDTHFFVSIIRKSTLQPGLINKFKFQQDGYFDKANPCRSSTKITKSDAGGRTHIVYYQAGDNQNIILQYGTYVRDV